MVEFCLIRVPNIMPVGSVTTGDATPPLGVCYLAASVRDAGHDITVIDSVGEALGVYTKITNSQLLIHGLTAEQIV